MNAVLTDVCLPWPELRRAGSVGWDRYVRATAAGRRLEHGQDGDDYRTHMLGAMGECVIARILNVYWMGDLGKPDRHAPDVGPWHIRTAQRPTDRLLLHHDDPDDGRYVLVVKLRLPTFRIVGWCHGRDGKNPAFWDTPAKDRPAGACFCVPHDALRPFTGGPD